MKKLAILDDYQNVVLTYADWDLLKDRVDITVFRDTIHDIDRLVERLEPFEIIVTNRERTPFPRQLIERLPNLRLLTTTGMKNHAFDVPFARQRAIYLTGTNSPIDSSAEIAWAMILAITRNICEENAAMHATGWQVSVGHGLKHKVLGVLGLAPIGTEVAKVGKAFGMRVVAWSSNLTEERCREVGVELVDKATFFSISDILTIHIRLSARTHRLVGKEDIARMKPTAYFINTSRGPIVDEPALVDALERGAIAGAALDVFEVEPLPVNHPLRKLKNTLLTPHMGYVTDQQYREYWPQTVENIIAFLDGNPIRPLNLST